MSNYKYYGVEYINKLMLNDIKNHIYTFEFPFYQLNYIYYNVIQFKNSILKKHL